MKKVFFVLFVVLFVVSCDKAGEEEYPDEQSNLEIKLKSMGFTKINSSNLNLEESLVFESDEQALEFFQDFLKDKGVEKSTVIHNNSFSRACGKRITITGTRGLGLDFNVSYTANNISNDGTPSSISDVSANISGITLGVGFTENYSSTTINNDGTVSTYTEATVDYNLFVEGIGTVYSQNVVIRTLANINPCGNSSGGGGGINRNIQEMIIERANR